MSQISGVIAEAARTAAVGVDSPLRFTADFDQWLTSRGLRGLNGFGGRVADSPPLGDRRPVVFIHGNGDQAGGWAKSRAVLIEAGYDPSEVYAVSWGGLGPSAFRSHTPEHIARVRSFIEAVRDYSGSAQVDVVAHSMGVTLARKAIRGDVTSTPLTDSIGTFIGIAGANRGLVNAVAAPWLPAFSPLNGFYPGGWFLTRLNATTHFEGTRVYSIWSPDDEVIGYKNLVWGQRTSRIPGQDGEIIRPALGHLSLRDETTDSVLALLRGYEPIVDGTTISRSYPVPGGVVEWSARAKIDGTRLHLERMNVVPRETGQMDEFGQPHLFLSTGIVNGLRREIAREMAAWGFTELRITGTRVTGANYRPVDLTVRLTPR